MKFGTWSRSSWTAVSLVLGRLNLSTSPPRPSRPMDVTSLARHAFGDEVELAFAEPCAREHRLRQDELDARRWVPFENDGPIACNALAALRDADRSGVQGDGCVGLRHRVCRRCWGRELLFELFHRRTRRRDEGRADVLPPL